MLISFSSCDDVWSDLNGTWTLQEQRDENVGWIYTGRGGSGEEWYVLVCDPLLSLTLHSLTLPMFFIVLFPYVPLPLPCARNRYLYRCLHPGVAQHWLIETKADFEAVGHSAWQLCSMEDPTTAESVWPLGLSYATSDGEKADVVILSFDQPKNTTKSTAAAAGGDVKSTAAKGLWG